MDNLHLKGRESDLHRDIMRVDLLPEGPDVLVIYVQPYCSRRPPHDAHRPLQPGRRVDALQFLGQSAQGLVAVVERDPDGVPEIRVVVGAVDGEGLVLLPRGRHGLRGLREAVGLLLQALDVPVRLAHIVDEDDERLADLSRRIRGSATEIDTAGGNSGRSRIYLLAGPRDRERSRGDRQRIHSGPAAPTSCVGVGSVDGQVSRGDDKEFGGARLDPSFKRQLVQLVPSAALLAPRHPNNWWLAAWWARVLAQFCTPFPAALFGG
jgi:hypothetical protein